MLRRANRRGPKCLQEISCKILEHAIQ